MHVHEIHGGISRVYILYTLFYSRCAYIYIYIYRGVGEGERELECTLFVPGKLCVHNYSYLVHSGH